MKKWICMVLALLLICCHAFAQQDLCAGGNALYEAGDYAAAFEAYTAAAEAGDGFGWYQLGKMYEEGVNLPRDIGRALECYSLAIEAGEPAAFGAAGKLYELGEYVPKDTAKALEYYAMGAEQNDFYCIMYLHGVMLDEGMEEYAGRSIDQWHAMLTDIDPDSF